MSPSNALGSKSDRLERSLRLESYCRLFYNLLKAALIVIVIIGLVYIHGYLFTIFTLHQSRQEYGIYPTLEQALQSINEPYDRYFIGLQSVSIAYQAPINENCPFIWEVRTNNVTAQSLADGSPITARNRVGKIYYIHIRDGWIPYIKDTWIEIGFLPHWMRVYHLYGEAD